jgi:hypothetical protein
MRLRDIFAKVAMGIHNEATLAVPDVLSVRERKNTIRMGSYATGDEKSIRERAKR